MAPIKPKNSDDADIETGKKRYKTSTFWKNLLSSVVVGAAVFCLGKTPAGTVPLTPRALQQCLTEVCDSGEGATECVRHPVQDDDFYSWVNPFNKARLLTLAAVVRPWTAAQVLEVVQCTVMNRVKVEARSGGNSHA